MLDKIYISEIIDKSTDFEILKYNDRKKLDLYIKKFINAVLHQRKVEYKKENLLFVESIDKDYLIGSD